MRLPFNDSHANCDDDVEEEKMGKVSFENGDTVTLKGRGEYRTGLSQHLTHLTYTKREPALAKS